MTIINVNDFGAKGDQATDDTEALRRAFAAAQPGDTVGLPRGTYLLCETIWSADVDIRGEQ